MKRTALRLLIVLTGLNLLNYLDRYVLSGVLTPLKADLHLSDGELGRLQTAFMLGYFLTCPFFGWLGDRGPRHKLIAFGIFVWSLGTVLTSFGTSLSELIAYRGLVGVGEAAYATLSPALLFEAFPATRRNFALSIFYVAIPVGSALGYIVGGSVSAAWGWPAAFLAAGAPGLFLALLLLLIPEERTTHLKSSSAQLHGKDILQLLKHPPFLKVTLGYTAYTFALGAYGYWGPAFVHRQHGISNAQATLFFGALLVIGGLLGTLTGALVARHHKAPGMFHYLKTLWLPTLLAVPLSALAFLSPHPGVTWLALGLSIYFIFIPTGPINTLTLLVVPATVRSSAMALSISMTHLFGDLWSPEIVGHLADRFHNLPLALLILPAALMLAVLIWMSLYRENQEYVLSKSL